MKSDSGRIRAICFSARGLNGMRQCTIKFSAPLVQRVTGLLVRRRGLFNMEAGDCEDME